MDLLRRFNTKHNFIETPLLSLECGEAVPPAPKRQGYCIVLGTHPCYLEDLLAARRKYHNPDICGINEAGKLLALDHLATCHGERLDQFIQIHRDKYPNKPDPLIHTRDITEIVNDVAGVTVYRWPVRTMAGSAPFAAAAMVMMGYSKVIMCGCPMDGGGGYAFNDTHKSTRADPRIGYEDSTHPMVKSWIRCMKKFKEEFPEISSRICSASGVTKEIFGGL